MNASDLKDRLVVEFLEQLLAEEAAGQVPDLDRYLARRPDAEGAIREAFSEFERSRAAAPPLLIAERLGPYKPIKLLGRGGQGSVWLAEDPRLRRQVAIKTLDRVFTDPKSFLLRFRREAELMARVHHPGICAVHDAGVEGAIPWIAIQYGEGPPLAAVPAPRGNPPPPGEEFPRLLHQFEQIARAVQVAHDAGVVHRDLKPNNILIGADGRPVILDFGLARDLSDSSATLTVTGAVFGTPAYMSPEQVRGDTAAVGTRSDVWALGATLCTALTGHPPFAHATFEGLRERILEGRPPSLSNRNPAVGRDLDLVFATALALEPDRRYSSAGALADDLRRILDGKPILARRPSVSSRVWSFARRNPAPTTTLSLLALVLVLGLASTTWALLQAERRLEMLLETADLKNSQDLIARAPSLYPIGPAQVPAMERWLKEAETTLSRRATHESALRLLAAGGIRAADAVPGGTDWFRSLLEELLRSYDKLGMTVTQIEERRQRSATLLARSTLAEPAAWAACVEAVAKHRPYQGLKLTPIPGLVPLGADSESTLHEFWHVETGARPIRDPKTGRLRIDAETGMVFVLIPECTTTLGATVPLDPTLGVTNLEGPALEVSLDAYFISKFEITQAQWERITGGDRPSIYQPGSKAGREIAPEETNDVRMPVCNVDWPTAVRVLAQIKLVLPTEAQWECAADAAGRSKIVTYADQAELEGSCNLCGQESEGRFSDQMHAHAFNDGFIGQAPVGSFRPNFFGLHDTLGNAWEMCADILTNYSDASVGLGDGLLSSPPTPVVFRMLRGGSHWSGLQETRTTFRIQFAETDRYRDVGLRPVIRIPK